MRPFGTRVATIATATALALTACSSGGSGTAPQSSAVMTTTAPNSTAATTADTNSMTTTTVAAMKVPTPVADACPVVADGLSCWKVAVPVDYSLPEGPTLDIAVTVARLDPTSWTSPILRAGIPAAVAWDRPLPTALPGHDYIGIDPRGQGRSAALSCSDLEKYKATLLIGRLDDTVAALLKQCMQGLLVGPVPLISAIDPQVAAMDAIIVRRALGIDKWGLYAAGYMTDRAVHMIELDPSSITGLMLVGPRIVGYGPTPGSVDAQLAAFVTDCAAAPACAANGDMNALSEALFAAAAGGLTSTNVNDETGKPVRFDDKMVRGAMSSIIGFQPVVTLVPTILAGGPQATVDQLVTTAEAQAQSPNPVDLALRCQQLSYVGLSALDRGESALCDAMGPLPQLAAAELLASNIPVLVLSPSYLDVTSDTAKQIFHNFTTLTVLNVPGMADPGLVIHDCWNGVRVAFFDNPTKPVDTACLTEPSVATFG